MKTNQPIKPILQRPSRLMNTPSMAECLSFIVLSVGGRVGGYQPTNTSIAPWECCGRSGNLGQCSVPASLQQLEGDRAGGCQPTSAIP